MTPEAIIEEAKEKLGVTYYLENGRLKVNGPPRVVNEGFCQTLYKAILDIHSYKCISTSPTSSSLPPTDTDRTAKTPDSAPENADGGWVLAVAKEVLAVGKGEKLLARLAELGAGVELTRTGIRITGSAASLPAATLDAIHDNRRAIIAVLVARVRTLRSCYFTDLRGREYWIDEDGDFWQPTATGGWLFAAKRGTV